MKKIVIKGGNLLSGEVDISVAKNAVLPIMAATILSDDIIKIEECPMLEDVRILSEILLDVGCEVDFDKQDGSLNICSNGIKKYTADCDLVQMLRGSFLIMGPMIAKYKKFTLACPGGCQIGSRPIDLHLKGFEALGAKVTQSYGFIEITGENLHGGNIYLDFPSVGATENIMMLASLTKGRTIIGNPALEPEIEDLANFLNAMGARVQFNVNSSIIIDGVESLSGVSYKPIYDRIEAGTFMVAAAITKSQIRLNGVNEEHLKPVIEKLREIGCSIEIEAGGDIAIVNGGSIIGNTDIKTLPHPGYPTDMQSQMMTLLSIGIGTSIIEENIFENRFMNVAELRKMGANIKIKGTTAIIEGTERLFGTTVKACDLRSGAALIIAGLIADGETIIEDIHHIDRGYVTIEEKFRLLGADIKRINM
ncbi:UDP-N-acetylglucosamine 1-carboxyvinyltransferase [uncultured Clostridium sp.]|uniref:UDP-N-acetylglucosamine 1-carboxyvinyltransferase n=1 Tax=uncultured Clostridium sp. TaxID=59620 RepID=UPI002621253A|nr:UDP-N-acetylglucosamine 1-carboxyvinyltransferase [uncultured Clostridium sp.]